MKEIEEKLKSAKEELHQFTGRAITQLVEENTKLKQMWEELTKISQNDDDDKITSHDFLWFLEKTIEELEKKYKLGE